MEGVQNAIDAYNATAPGRRDAAALGRGAVQGLGRRRCTSTTRARLASTWRNFDLGTPASGGWTIDVANDEFWDDRGNYRGRSPTPSGNSEEPCRRSTALPFGVSYEKFRNPGREVSLDFDGERPSQVAPPRGGDPLVGRLPRARTTPSSTSTRAGLPAGQTVDFTNWHFIEDGWDYGFVEALVGGEWVTVPLSTDGTRR